MEEKAKKLTDRIGADLIKLDSTAITSYICAKATKEEIVLFLNQCQMFQLNPFKREIYLIKYGSYPADIVVGYEVYLKRAERSKQWDGMESGIKGSLKKKDLVAWAKVYRKDWKRPLYHEVDYDEYVKKKSDDTVTRFWAKMPKTMLKKVAVSQAFRLAFPDEMGGLPYIVEEIDHIEEMKQPDALEKYHEETEESKEAETKADAKAKVAHISNYQVTEISRIETMLVDKFQMDPEFLVNRCYTEFKDKKQEDYSVEEADNWISILTKLLNTEIEKAKKAEEKPKESTESE